MIRVIVIDDHDLILRAVSDILTKQPDIELVGTSQKGSELHDLVGKASPDVVVLDLGMDEEKWEPIPEIKKLLQAHPDVRILILTAYHEPLYIKQVVSAGAIGYVLKSDNFSTEIPDAVRKVYRGEQYFSPTAMKALVGTDESLPELTNQEFQVLHWVSEGLANVKIGEKVGLSEKRIRNILTDIYRKLRIMEDKEIHMRVAVINKARELGLLLRYPSDHP